MNNLNQQHNRNKAKEINLKEYIDLIKRRIWIILVITFLTTMAGYWHSIYFKAPPLYEASTRFILNTSDEYMKTLIVLAEDPLVLDEVNNLLQLNKSADGLANQISVTNINQSQVVKLSVFDGDPEKAIAIANTTAEVFKKEINNILGFTDFRIVQKAKLDSNIKMIDQSNNRTLLAFVGGVVISIGLIFLLDTLDNTVRTAKEVEEILEVPIVGSISRMNKRNIQPHKKVKLEQEIRGETISVNQNFDY